MSTQRIYTRPQAQRPNIESEIWAAIPLELDAGQRYAVRDQVWQLLAAERVDWRGHAMLAGAVLGLALTVAYALLGLALVAWAAAGAYAVAVGALVAVELS